MFRLSSNIIFYALVVFLLGYIFGNFLLRKYDESIVKDLEKHQTSFIEDNAKYSNDTIYRRIPIYISKLDSSAGVTTTFVHKRTGEIVHQYITIDRGFYFKYEEYDCMIQALMYHELGHAIFRYDDIEPINSDSIKVTNLMWHSIEMGVWWCFLTEEERDAELKRFFNGNKIEKCTDEDIQ